MPASKFPETSHGRAASPEANLAPRLRAVIGKLSRRLRPTAAAIGAGLSPTRVSVLLAVDRAGAIRLSELAATEGINPTMLSRVIANLAEGGLVERLSDPRDKRSAWIRPTPDGRRLTERIRRERTDAVAVALAALGEEERQQVEAALPAFEALIERLDDFPRRRQRAEPVEASAR